jgi:hypothetical protein
MPLIHPQPALTAVPWEQRLESIMDMMREMSSTRDPRAIQKPWCASMPAGYGP